LLAAFPGLASAKNQVNDFFNYGLAPEQGLYRAKVRFIPKNSDAWYARWYVLNQAKKSIDMTYFNFYKDVFGKAVLGLLHKKAEEGVKVRLMVDNRGSFGLAHSLLGKRYLKELSYHPNITVKVYRPFLRVIRDLPSEFREFVGANHDKILVADGKLAVMGGRNMGQKYFVDPEDDPEVYIDRDVMMQGKDVCKQLTRAFEGEYNQLRNHELAESWMGDWKDQRPELEIYRLAMDRWIKGDGPLVKGDVKKWRFARRANKKLAPYQHLTGFNQFLQDPWKSGGIFPCKVLDKHSLAGDTNEITPNLIRLFDSAEDEILIQNAYLVLTKASLGALKRASDRGVKIRILTNSPASTGNLMVQAFFVKDWKEWLHQVPNLRIFMTTGERKIHAKVFVVDGDVTLIGSYNIDPMSESINSEVVTLFQSGSFADQAIETIEADLKTATECQIRVEADGTVTGVVGPDDYLKGLAGKLIKLLGKIPWLRHLV
jgi:phosphatidylserine/phosphatidylglycerophosphate/cardiolipin synthase-like enzyme